MIHDTTGLKAQMKGRNHIKVPLSLKKQIRQGLGHWALFEVSLERECVLHRGLNLMFCFSMR